MLTERNRAIIVVRLELHSEMTSSTQAESASVRGHLMVSIRSPLSIPRATFKYRHLTADHTTTSSQRTNRSQRERPHYRPESTAIVSL